jgi:hypothetical protein
MMKTYEEMIQWIVDHSNNRLQYHEWPAVLAVAEMYGVPQQTVFNDMQFEKDLREKSRKEQRKAEHLASNEQRRLANLAAKGIGS